jgi:hypothetical protein
VVSWAGFFLWGSAVVGDGGRGSSGGVQVLCTSYVWSWRTVEIDVLFVGFVSEVVKLRVARSCVSLGITLYSRCLVYSH